MIYTHIYSTLWSSIIERSKIACQCALGEVAESNRPGYLSHIATNLHMALWGRLSLTVGS
jgi:hypothetical protein